MNILQILNQPYYNIKFYTGIIGINGKLSTNYLFKNNILLKAEYNNSNIYNSTNSQNLTLNGYLLYDTASTDLTSSYPNVKALYTGNSSGSLAYDTTNKCYVLTSNYQRCMLPINSTVYDNVKFKVDLTVGYNGIGVCSLTQGQTALTVWANGTYGKYINGSENNSNTSLCTAQSNGTWITCECIKKGTDYTFTYKSLDGLTTYFTETLSFTNATDTVFMLHNSYSGWNGSPTSFRNLSIEKVSS